MKQTQKRYILIKATQIIEIQNNIIISTTYQKVNQCIQLYLLIKILHKATCPTQHFFLKVKKTFQKSKPQNFQKFINFSRKQVSK